MANPMKWVTRELARIRLAVWVLIVMFVTMIVGSIFPQGYDPETYIESWGEAKHAALAKWGLLDLFHTKYFLILGFLLLLNLVFCSIVRWFGRSGVGLAGETAPTRATEIDLAGAPDAASANARRVLESRGYKILSDAGGVITARRGPWPEGVSLLYHLALAVAIVGFCISALRSFGGDVTLYPGKPVSVQTMSKETGAYRIGSRKADWSIGAWHPLAAARPDTTAWKERQVTLTLNEFRTEWELSKGKYYPKDWFSDVDARLTDNGRDRTWKSRLIEVNRPLRVGGLTFYQTAYEQSFDVVVLRDGAPVERVPAQAYVPFTLNAIGGMFFPGDLRVGTLFEKYRPTVPVVPHVELKWQPPAAGAAGGTVAEGEATAAGDAGAAVAPKAEKVDVGNLSSENPLVLEGFTLLLENPYEGSVLSYRHDPGVPFLYIAITAFIIGLALRTYWPSYRVSLWVEGTPGGTKGRMVFRAAGMLGEPEEIEKSLVSAFTERRG